MIVTGGPIEFDHGMDGVNIGQEYDRDRTRYTFLGKLFSFRIYRDGQLYREYLPCRYEGEGVLYETVEREILRSVGDRPCTVGPDK